MAAFGVIAHVRTILNKMASFGVNIYWSSASEHGQNITNITTNTDLNKTSHFRVAFLENNCKKLFLVLNS